MLWDILGRLLRDSWETFGTLKNPFKSFREAFIKKKKCNIFYNRVWPPQTLFSEKCNENKKKKYKAF